MNVYAFRYPGDRKIYSGSGRIKYLDRERLEAPCDGFLVSDFSGAYRSVIVKESDFDIRDAESLILSSLDCVGYRVPQRSTSEKEHHSAVESILKSISKRELKKCVLARVIIKKRTHSIDKVFGSLCEKFPNAFVFFFFTPQTGGWIGASPEILLCKDSDRLRTMALAGTRVGGNKDNWDEKNIEEHEMVTDYIMDCMQSSNLSPIKGERRNLQYGTIEHLMTPIDCDLKNEVDPLELAAILSPTPALCGLPRHEALAKIREVEKFDRGCYGGYCGPIMTNGDFRLFVNLRSFCISEDKACIYAGGGIVRGSNPKSEWEETVRKSEELSELI